MKQARVARLPTREASGPLSEASIRAAIKPISILLVTALTGVSFKARADVTTEYLYNDAQGTPVAAADEQGNLLWRKHHAPFGEEIAVEGDTASAVAGDRSYTGHQLDRSSGLIYMGARHYNPRLGLFYGRDPAPVVADRPFTYNRYAYANQNPYGYVDPDGRFPWALVLVALGLLSFENDENVDITAAVGGAGDVVDFGRSVGDARDNPSFENKAVAVVGGVFLALPGDQPSASKMLPVIRKGTKAWDNAVASIREARKGSRNTNVRVESATDAKELLTEALGQMDRRKQYRKTKYKKGYEVHNQSNARELEAGNDLPHLKWKANKTDGHVYYDKPN